MIIFELGCMQGHHFEGWFASADDFARQAGLAMVRCPECDDEHIAIVPSAKVRVAKHAAATPPAPAEPPEPASAEAVIGLPPEFIRKLREVMKATEDVGRRFPDEARKIHYDEVPARPIRGQASHEEAEALRDEGIEFALLPPILTREHH